MRAVIIEPGQAPRVEQLDGPADIRAAVGYDFAGIRLGERAVGYIAIIDTEKDVPAGGEIHVPINRVGTVVARAGRAIDSRCWILGTVVICGMDEHGNREDIQESYVRSVKKVYVTMNTIQENN